MGCVRVRTNLYSAPVRPGTTVEVRIGPSHIDVREEGRSIARHERCYEHQQQILELEHYLDVLERKPGALVGSKPLAVWREKGSGPRAMTPAGRVDQPARQVQRHAADDPGCRIGEAIWTYPTSGIGSPCSVNGMLGCRGDSPSGIRKRASSSTTGRALPQSGTSLF